MGNCQVAVSLHHVGEHGHAVPGWRLYLPARWTTDPARRQAAGIPDEVVFQPKWQLGLDLIDQARAWGLADRIVVAEAGYGDATEFRNGLEAGRLAYIVRIAAMVEVWTQRSQCGELSLEHQYRWRVSLPLPVPSLSRPASGPPA